MQPWVLDVKMGFPWTFAYTGSDPEHNKPASAYEQPFQGHVG